MADEEEQAPGVLREGCRKSNRPNSARDIDWRNTVAPIVNSSSGFKTHHRRTPLADEAQPATPLSRFTLSKGGGGGGGGGGGNQ